MKVTLRRSYTFDSVVVDPQQHRFDEMFQVDMEQKEVLDILRIQVEMEQLQQKLLPLFKVCEEAAKQAAEAKKEAEELAKLQADPEFIELHQD